MKKKIWILNHHANDTFFDNGGRHYFFSKYLKEKGYDPVIFCSNAEHGTGKLYFKTDKIWTEHINEKIGVKYIFIKGRSYVGNGINRILCMFDYFFNIIRAANEYEKLYGKPDIIIGSQVHPLAILAAEYLAKKYKIKYIAEIRDLWPESIVAMGIASKRNPIIALLRFLEKRIYVDSDAIIFTFEGGYDYIKKRGWEKIIPSDKVFYINNGIDLEQYNENVLQCQYYDEDIEDNTMFKIVYTGSIRKANGLEELVDVAGKMKQNRNIKFFIYGDGDYKTKLETKVKTEKLENIIFKGKIEKNLIPYILSKSDLNILNYNQEAAHNGLYTYGSSQNKLFEYLASGKPVLSNYTNDYDLIKQYNCGISRNIGSTEEYVEAINEIYSKDNATYKNMCFNALGVAKQFDFKILTKKLIDVIEMV